MILLFCQVGRLLLSSHLFLSKQQVQHSQHWSIILWSFRLLWRKLISWDFWKLNLLGSTGERQSPFFSSTTASPTSNSGQFTKCLHNTATVKRVSNPMPMQMQTNADAEPKAKHWVDKKCRPVSCGWSPDILSFELRKPFLLNTIWMF